MIFASVFKKKKEGGITVLKLAQNPFFLLLGTLAFWWLWKGI